MIFEKEADLVREKRAILEKQGGEKPQGLRLAQHFAKPRLPFDMGRFFSHIGQAPYA